MTVQRVATPRVLAIIPGFIPSAVIGVVRPLLALRRDGAVRTRIALVSSCKLSDLSEADVVVFCRLCEPSSLSLLYRAKALGKRVIYDLDDNFFEIPLDIPLGLYHRHGMRLFAVTEFMKLADEVRVFSQRMFLVASQYSQNVVRGALYFEFDLLNGVRRPKADGVIRICYQTSRAVGDTGFNLFASALDKVLEEGRGSVLFYCWGSEAPPLRSKDHVRQLPYQQNYPRFVKSFYSSCFDIGLAPMNTDHFSQSKTNNKFREYGACEVAGVYSRTAVYEECVRDGYNGLIVENDPDAWLGAIRKLIEDEDLRRSIQKSARSDVGRQHSFAAALDSWRSSITGQNAVVAKDAPVDFKPSDLRLLVTGSGLGGRAKLDSLYEVCRHLGVKLQIARNLVSSWDLDFGHDHAFDPNATIIFADSPKDATELVWRSRATSQHCVVFLSSVKGAELLPASSSDFDKLASVITKLSGVTLYVDAGDQRMANRLPSAKLHEFPDASNWERNYSAEGPTSRWTQILTRLPAKVRPDVKRKSRYMQAVERRQLWLQALVARSRQRLQLVSWNVAGR